MQSLDAAPGFHGADATGSPTVDIVVPVYNEAAILSASIERLHAYLERTFPFGWRITIADNASTDDTLAISEALAARLPGVEVLHLADKGRGRALRAAWSRSDAAVVAYMDVDLSTGLDALLPLVAPLVSGHSDVAIGSRLSTGAHVVRGTRRELISRTYNRLLQATFRNGFRDAQCGFKAVRADVARALLPEIEDDGWFFDTELLLLAEHNGLRVSEVPVDWIDDPDSRVHVVSTAKDDLKGMLRVARRCWSGRGRIELGALARPERPTATGGAFVRFATIGVASTVAYVALFVLLRASMGAYLANAVALTCTVVVNTALNRRSTFGLRGPGGRSRAWIRSSLLHAGALVVTTLALVAAHGIAPHATVTQETIALVLSGGLATAARVLLLPTWVFRTDPAPAH
jgi:putative flippase GtrA